MEERKYDWTFFQEELLKMGISLEKRQIQQFQDYYEILTEWNSFMNLTAVTEFEDVVVKHFLDSLTLVKAVSRETLEKDSLFLADVGTLYLEDVEALSPLCQEDICRLIRYRRGGRDYRNPKPVRIRVAASSRRSLRELGELTEQGSFKAELFYLLAGLVLEIPPLRRRPEDLEELIHQGVREAFEQYGRYHKITAGAERLLREYAWPGNLIQLRTFLNRMVLTADRHSIDEIQAGRLLAELYPAGLCREEQEEQQEVAESREEREIRAALAEEGGSRENTARRLGISKATLWRKMKKYKIL